MSNVFEEEEEVGCSGDCLCIDSVIDVEDDDGALTRCCGAQDPQDDEAADSPADIAVPISPSWSPVSFSFLSSGRAPSFWFLLAVVSS